MIKIDKNIKEGDIVKVTYYDITQTDNYSTKQIKEFIPKTMAVFGKIIQLSGVIKVLVEEDCDQDAEHNAYSIPEGCVQSVIKLHERRK